MRRVTGCFAVFLVAAGMGNAALGQAATAVVEPVALKAAPDKAVDGDPGALSGRNEGATGVRIVRLSATRGPVELDRQTGRGFETGFVNLPIVEGNQLHTGDLAWAEVELEDDSTFRMTPNSSVQFETLRRSPSGTTASGVTLVQGTLYISRARRDAGEVTVTAAGKKIRLPQGSHVRLDVYPAGSELVVVQGQVHVEDLGTAFDVDKHHALKFGGEAQTAHLVSSKDEAPGLYDRWDAVATDYHKGKSLLGSAGTNNGYGFGGQDLRYYGNFQNIDGCGRVWQPYLAGANFSPFNYGTWAYYPQAGYSFVSPYTWGWTTFHSGDWISCGGSGWGWRPGAWVGLDNHRLLLPAGGSIHKPRPIGAPPVGKPTFVAAGDGQVARSKIYADHPGTFVAGSAGLGIPRGSVENLKEISKAVNAHASIPAARISLEPEAIDPFVSSKVAARASGAELRTPGSGISAAGISAAGSPAARPVVGVLSRPIAPTSLQGRSGGYDGTMRGSGRSSGFSAGANSGLAGGVQSGAAHNSGSSRAASGSGSIGGARGGSAAGGSATGGGHK